MKIAFFGGTFDPVHRGHVAIARAAARKFDLSLIYFAPADIPPHKQKRVLADFRHRYAMLALATSPYKRFVPSLIEEHTGEPNYSYETVLRLKKTLFKSDRLHFLIGIDAFKEIGSWHKPVELLGECDFIVVSRPGYSMDEIIDALPAVLRSKAQITPDRKSRRKTISLPESTICVLDHVRVPVSSTQIRAAAQGSLRQLRRYVPNSVAEYIKKESLYIEHA